MKAPVDFDLRGKDWLTELEAAHYCGVSLGQLSAHSRQFKQTRRFLGKKLYSREELFGAIYRAPLWNPEPQAVTGYIPTYAGASDKLRERLQGVRQRPYKPRPKQRM